MAEDAGSAGAVEKRLAFVRRESVEVGGVDDASGTLDVAFPEVGKTAGKSALRKQKKRQARRVKMGMGLSAEHGGELTPYRMRRGRVLLRA